MLLKNQFEKMNHDGSWIIGGVTGGVTIAIPQWIYQKEWSIYHTILMVIMMSVLIGDWIVGNRLAKKSPVKRKVSEVAIDAIIRDGLIVAICTGAYGFDFLLGTGSIIYVVFTSAFIYHNLYSLLANIEVLGWSKNFPMWLIKWLDDEIKAKTDKYFPNGKDDKK